MTRFNFDVKESRETVESKRRRELFEMIEETGDAALMKWTLDRVNVLTSKIANWFNIPEATALDIAGDHVWVELMEYREGNIDFAADVLSLSLSIRKFLVAAHGGGEGRRDEAKKHRRISA